MVLSIVIQVLWSQTNAVGATPTACTLPTIPNPIPMAGFYVLAYDNGEEGQFNLESKYEATVSRLLTATVNRPDSVAVILADLGSADDTHIVVAINGVETILDCLPDENYVLDSSIQEYDVTDGRSLAHFLVWARTTFPSGTNTFTYVGHGNPVTPYSVPKISDIITTTMNALSHHTQNHLGGTIFPLPTQLDANPSFTDHHAPAEGELGLITPHALATALAEATNDGMNKFDMVDLLHCFAASIDELNEIAPYTDGIVASPNYAFFDPAMPGIAFEFPWVNAVVTLYDDLHPATEHPHILAGIEGDTVVRIFDEWQNVSAELMNEFDANAEQTTNHLMTAYLRSVKYDTSVCDADMDWALEPPDALSDMKSFALELHTLYEGENAALTLALTDTIDALQDSIVLNISQDGTPYFEEENPDHWTFLPDESGISLFTPFQPTEIGGDFYLPWQTLWYTSTLTYALPGNVQINNPEPFEFITAVGQPTWADVVARFWKETNLRPGLDVNTFFCTTELVAFKNDAADLQTALQVSDTHINRGDMLTMTITLSNTNIATATQPVLTFQPHETAVSWLQIQSVRPDQFCNTVGHITRCELPAMLPNTNRSLQFIYHTTTGMMPEPFSLTAKVNAFADTYDPNPIDNQQIQQIIVNSTGQLYLPISLK